MSSDEPTDTNEQLPSPDREQFETDSVSVSEITVGDDAFETVSESETPGAFSFFAGDGRDVLYQLDLLVENTAVSLQNAGITVSLYEAQMYDDDDEFTATVSEHGTQLQVEYRSLDFEAGGRGIVTFYDDGFELPNRNVFVEVLIDNADITLKQTNAHVLAGTYKTLLREGGGQVIADHFGRHLREVDPIDGSVNFPHGLKTDDDPVIGEEDKSELNDTIDTVDDNLRDEINTVDGNLRDEINTVESNLRNEIDQLDQRLNVDLVHATEDDEVEGLLTFTRNGEPVTSRRSANEAIRFAGPTSDLLLDIQGGHGRVGLAWNAYFDRDDYTWHRLVGNEEPVMLHMNNGQIALRTADTGPQYSSIDWDEAVVTNGSINQADNANQLDGFDSSQFLRSDETDQFTGRALVIDGDSRLSFNQASSISENFWKVETDDTTGGFAIAQDGTGGYEFEVTSSNGDYRNSEVRAGGSRLLKETNVGDGLELDGDTLRTALRRYDNDDFNYTRSRGVLHINLNNGLHSTSNGLSAKLGPGVRHDTNGNIFVDTASNTGLQIDSGLVGINHGANLGYGTIRGNEGLYTKFASSYGIDLTDHGQIRTKIGPGLAYNSNGQIYPDTAGGEGSIVVRGGSLGVRVGGGIGRNSDNDLYVRTGPGLRLNDNGQVVLANSDGGSNVEAASKEQVTTEDHHQDVTIDGPTETFELDSLPEPFDGQQAGNIQFTPLNRTAGDLSWHVAHLRPNDLKIQFHSPIDADDEASFRLSLLV